MTGYGEGLLLEALRVDSGEIETVAHLRGAQEMLPGVEFILDIGGQDMKCLRVKDGVIDHIMLNEACSSGCGSFIESFASGLNLDVAEFAQTAIRAKAPVDLGSRCTVFMNSRVKQAQKEGATVGDIAAGLAISVIKNALFKVIKIRDPHDVGTKVIVQGGTFLNDAVLRAFEQLSEVNAVRPDIAGNMGAYGAALLARDRYREAAARAARKAQAGDAWSTAELDAARRGPLPVRSTLLTLEQIEALSPTHKTVRCKACSNHCLLTVNDFGVDEATGKHRRFITGNRCEKGAGTFDESKNVPNLYEYKSKRLFGYEPLAPEAAPRGSGGHAARAQHVRELPVLVHVLHEAGLPRGAVRPVHEKDLRGGHRVHAVGERVLSGEAVARPHHEPAGQAPRLHLVPVQQVGAPGGRGRGQPLQLPHRGQLRRGAAPQHRRAARIQHAVPEPLAALRPQGEPERSACSWSWWRRTRSSWGRPCCAHAAEVDAAVEAAWAEDEAFKRDIRAKGEETLAWMEATGTHGIVLAGRPYHNDPEINHAIPELLTSFGLAVLTEDSMAHLGTLERPIRLVDQWMYHTRLYAAAKVATERRDLDLIQLNSFGCGLDALTTDQVQEILEAAGKVYTVLKIDEVSNLGAARIRVRSLLAALKDQADEEAEAERMPRGCPAASLDVDALVADANARIDAKTGATEGSHRLRAGRRRGAAGGGCGRGRGCGRRRRCGGRERRDGRSRHLRGERPRPRCASASGSARAPPRSSRARCSRRR